MIVELIIGCVVAAAAWAVMFVPPRTGFWPRAAGAGIVISAYAVAVEPSTMGHLFSRHHWAADIGVGVASGLILYAVFFVGEQLLVIVLPKLAAEVTDLYDIKGRAPDWVIPVVVATATIGEELFYRGLVQRQAGVVAALIVYVGVHLWARRFILLVAALIGGLWWGGLLAWTGGMIAPLTSHLVWGISIIVIHPARPTAWAERLRSRLLQWLHHRSAAT